MTQPRLAQLHQSAALIGQVPVWNGTTWVADMPQDGVDSLAAFDDAYDPALGSYDYEFNAFPKSSSLPSGWSWVNQGDSLYLEAGGQGKVDVAYTGGTTNATETHRMLVRSLPSESAWFAVAKLDVLGERSNHVRGGLVLRNSGSGAYLFFGRSCGNPGDVDLSTWSALSTLNTTIATREYTGPPGVFAINKAASDDWTFYVSPDGLGFTGHEYSVDLSAAGYDQIGILGGTPNTIYDWPVLVASWFRVRP